MHKAVLAALIAGAGLAPVPVLADAREDVVNGMTRCAGLTDDRQWLDCYYGAAQPMRAWLGLPPAPQSQLKLLQQTSQPTAPAPAIRCPPPLRAPPCARVRRRRPSGPASSMCSAARTWSITPRSSPIR